MTKELYKEMVAAKEMWRRLYTQINNEIIKFLKTYEKFDNDEDKLDFRVFFDEQDIVVVKSGVYIDQDFLDKLCEEFDFTLIYRKEELVTNYQVGIDSFHVSEYGFMANK